MDFLRKKIQDQQTPGTFFDVEFCRKYFFSAEILRKIIESAEVVHKTKSCVMEFRSAEKWKN